MHPEGIVRQVFGPGVDSTNRLNIMMDLIQDSPRDVFWTTFQLVWPTCDTTWRSQGAILEALRWNAPAIDFLEGADSGFFKSLREVSEVYRGCSLSRVRGLSWTTDRKVATSFARGHRSMPVVEAVVAKANIPISAVLTVSTKRGESEVIVDPDELPDNVSLLTFDLQRCRGS